MIESLVIDTGILTLYFAGDPRVGPYFERVKEETAEGYISSVNLSEYYYKTCQKIGKETALQRYQQSRTFLTPVETDEALALAAGVEKCRRNELSLADCFAVSLTRRLNGILLTTDKELGRIGDVAVKVFELRRG